MLQLLKPASPRDCAPQQEEPMKREALSSLPESSPCLPQLCCPDSNVDPAQSIINKSIKLLLLLFFKDRISSSERFLLPQVPIWLDVALLLALSLLKIFIFCSTKGPSCREQREPLDTNGPCLPGNPERRGPRREEGPSTYLRTARRSRTC